MALGRDETAIDRRLVRQMSQAPMSREEWKRHLRAHRKFLAKAANRQGSWQVLVVAGLPIAVWEGAAEGDGEQLNLRYANLSGLDLRLASLSRAALVGVVAEGRSFRGATLEGALLTDAFLDGADFSVAKMAGADLSRASLRNACFEKAMLLEADFEGADLTGADFTGAELRYASFHRAILDGVSGFTLPIFSGEDPAAELRTIVERFHGFPLQRQLAELARRFDQATLYRVLLEALRTGAVDFGEDEELWRPLTEAGAADFYDAEDYLRLVRAVAAGAPDGRIPFPGGGGWSNLWTEGGVPGRAWGLHAMLEHKHAALDDEFFEALSERFEGLPEPYGSGVRSSLMELGRLPRR